ncbi:hypothetical protein KQY30_19550 [Streptomyces sp. GMY02]|uniref:hypothetical protein n=1 Tax=Streptomyces sp. GMY02 TaxID=1333528 RepID=UPI001C2C4D4C|nr:hypothetical protein [Streptomyces sp. GMY02]QXE36105.1 hypothetical protein KQY30_19550 [Streptomyces sp. GMY02]
MDGYVWQVAVQDQWKKCMARYGFRDFGPPPVSEQSVTAQTNSAMGRRYGISDPALALKYGYHLPAETEEPPHWEPAQGAESAVFTGTGVEVESGVYEGERVPEGGCRGEARRMFPMPQTPEAQQLGAVVFEQSRTDSDVVSAVAKWSSCMGEKGYERNHPLEDLRELGISLSSPVTEGEIAQAIADVACKEETGLVKIWNAQESEKQEKVIAENASKLTEEKSVKEASDAKVRQAYTAASNR